MDHEIGENHRKRVFLESQLFLREIEFPLRRKRKPMGPNFSFFHIVINNKKCQKILNF